MRLRMYTSLVEDLRECMEFALELRGFLRDDVLSIYPTVLDDFYITLIQSGDHILNNYDLQICCFTETQFKKRVV